MTSRDGEFREERVRVRVRVRLVGTDVDGMVGYAKWRGYEHDGDRWEDGGYAYLPVAATGEDAMRRLFPGAALLEPGAPEPAARRDRDAPCASCGRAAGMHHRDAQRSFETVLCDGSRLIL